MEIESRYGHYEVFLHVSEIIRNMGMTGFYPHDKMADLNFEMIKYTIENITDRPSLTGEEFDGEIENLLEELGINEDKGGE